MLYKSLGNSEISIPPIIFGTSSLGNLYQALSYETKFKIMNAIYEQMDGPFVMDTAGKYGAGLALEVIGQGLDDLDITDEAIISNKLGWIRTPLKTPEPIFEPGAWIGLENDAEQKISYKGILECWEQGCELLGGREPQIVSVHDPDEYLAPAQNEKERKERFDDILQAYRGLDELRKEGKTSAVGVGAKDWHVIRNIVEQVDLDWVMLAVSFTIYTHPQEMLNFLDELQKRNIAVINSAVFHAGFLTGGKYFDYQVLNEQNAEHKHYFEWREQFFSLCKECHVLPSDACVQFGMSHPAVVSIALNTSKPERVEQNIRSVSAEIPNDFWEAMKYKGLMDKAYPYVAN